MNDAPAQPATPYRPRFSAAGCRASPYAPARPGDRIDLFLDANEGPCAATDAVQLLTTLHAISLPRYPDAAVLTELLAARFKVSPTRVLVTAGGDDAIDRACRISLEHGREVVLPTPTFEMIASYARVCGASITSIPWLYGPYPLDAVQAAVTPQTSMIAVVSPNNPTGAAAAPRDIQRLSAAAPDALILTDLAYAEFADADLTQTALALPNTLVVRTFSKAYGLAGLRVGYAIGPEPVISAMRAVAGPFPVSTLSLAAAASALQHGDAFVKETVAKVRSERERLVSLLHHIGAEPFPSEANFVLARFDDAEHVWRSLAALGIAVRRFNGRPDLEQMLRITCPGDEANFNRLCDALRSIHPRFASPMQPARSNKR